MPRKTSIESLMKNNPDGSAQRVASPAEVLKSVKNQRTEDAQKHKTSGESGHTNKAASNGTEIKTDASGIGKCALL